MKVHKIIVMVLLALPMVTSAVPQRKPGLDFVDMVYTINLPQSTDRKEHIVAEFKRVGIKKYKIIPGVDKDSIEVKTAMRNGFVKRYPPCFRCNKKLCKCENNVLLPPHVGNFLAFINVFKDIVKNNYEYVLITEDDVKFTDDAHKIMATLINFESFAKYNIDVNKPLVIGLYGRFEPQYRDLGDIHLYKDINVSNPCFLVNKKFAEVFLENLREINTTSELYIHGQLEKINPDVQRFLASPRPAYELSYRAASGVPAKFASTIIPRKLKQKKAQLKEGSLKLRTEYWDYLLDKYAFWRKSKSM